MPAQINGYELFQLQCSRDSGETTRFAEFRNPLGADGHRAQVLYGADTGLRRFSIPYDQVLTGNGIIGTIVVNGVTMNRAQYIRDLFKRTKVSGVPFVIQSIENGQYYLVEFEESEQTLTRKLSALYSTEVNLVQVRIPGVTVFDPTKLKGLWGWYDGTNGVADLGPAGNSLTPHGNITAGATQNGLPTTAFNSGATNDGYDNLSSASPVIYDALFVMKMREATFSNFAGVLTAAATLACLVGDSGTTKFVNLASGGIEYRKNGVLYPESNMQAPMNSFGVVHWRRSLYGQTLANIQIGKDRNFSGRYAEMDIGERFLFNQQNPLSDMMELAESRQEMWGI